MPMATPEMVKLFLAAAGQMRNHFERELGWPGVPLDARIIEAIVRDGPSTSRALCQVLALEKSTLSVAIKRLEAGEYVCRERGRHRAETIHVRPERLAKITDQILNAYSSCGAAFLALSHDQQKSLGEILHALTKPFARPTTCMPVVDGSEGDWSPYGDNPNPELEEGREQFKEHEEEDDHQ